MVPTVFYAEPFCNMKEDMYKFVDVKYSKEIELCKAYYQILLTAEPSP